MLTGIILGVVGTVVVAVIGAAFCVGLAITLDSEGG